MNQQVFNYLNSFAGQSKIFDGIVIFFGQYLAYVLVAVFLIIVIKNKNWRLLVIAGVSVFLSRFVITELIRFFYFVPRPFMNNPAVHQLIFNETSGSFPSGHAAAFFALAMAVWFFSKRWSVFFFICAILMGIARVMAGVHWPIDILGGAIIGILSAWLICKISGKIYNKY
jgi:undecaprenyl-diphosphatase